MSFAGTNFRDFGFQSLTLEANVRGFRAIFCSVFVARKLFTTIRDVILSCLFHLFLVLMSTIYSYRPARLEATEKCFGLGETGSHLHVSFLK